METLLTLREVAQLLRLSHQTVYKLIQDGILIAVKIGNQWRFEKKKIEEWLENQSHESFHPREKK